MSEMRLGVVIATLGLSGGLERLFESIAAQSVPAVDVVIVDQSPGLVSKQVVAQWSRAIPVRVVSSPVGLSRARNAGAAALVPCDVVAFTDDDCEYAPEAFARALAAIFSRDLAGISGQLQSELGPRTHFSSERIEMSPSNVWRNAIEAALFLRCEDFKLVHGFDEALGLGAGTPWGSGEGTDLLLRLMRHNRRLEYIPDVVILEKAHSHSVERSNSKIRAYGRGTGRVLRRNYGFFRGGARVVAPLGKATISAVRLDGGAAMKSLIEMLARVEGWLGRLVS